MNDNKDSESNAAVQTAGRELLTAVLQRKPPVAAATALMGPIIGLFGRRRVATATQIHKLRLERYRSRSEPGETGQHRRGTGTTPVGDRMQAEGLPSPAGLSGAPRRARHRSDQNNPKTGGSHHG